MSTLVFRPAPPPLSGSIQREDIVGQAKRTTRVRDLFPVRRTNAAVIEYFRQTGFTNNASTVPEYDSPDFGLKPSSSMTFVGEQAPVRTIAHWEAAHRNVLADEPQLRSIIDNELLYGLRLEEDDQILNGSGTGEDLTGILNVSGIQTYSWSSGPSTAPVADTKADAIRRASFLAFLAYYEPTGVVVHPSDFEDMELTKDSNGQYLMAVNIQQGAQAAFGTFRSSTPRLSLRVPLLLVHSAPAPSSTIVTRLPSVLPSSTRTSSSATLSSSSLLSSVWLLLASAGELRQGHLRRPPRPSPDPR